MIETRKLIASRIRLARRMDAIFDSWSTERCKAMWESLGGTHTSCMNKMKGHIATPGAYCNALGKRAKGKWVREK